MCSEVADVACTWKMSSNKLTWKNVKGVFENDRTWTSHLNGWSNIKILNSFLCAYFFARTVNNFDAFSQGARQTGENSHETYGGQTIRNTRTKPRNGSINWRSPWDDVFKRHSWKLWSMQRWFTERFCTCAKVLNCYTFLCDWMRRNKMKKKTILKLSLCFRVASTVEYVPLIQPPKELHDVICIVD